MILVRIPRVRYSSVSSGPCGSGCMCESDCAVWVLHALHARDRGAGSGDAVSPVSSAREQGVECYVMCPCPVVFVVVRREGTSADTGTTGNRDRDDRDGNLNSPTVRIYCTHEPVGRLWKAEGLSAYCGSSHYGSFATGLIAKARCPHSASGPPDCCDGAGTDESCFTFVTAK